MSRQRQPEARAGRVDAREQRRKRRRRRMVRGIARGIFWICVLAGVFVMGIGFGRLASGEGAGGGRNATVSVDRGDLMATLPTKTVIETKTVVKVRTVKVRAKAKKQ